MELQVLKLVKTVRSVARTKSDGLIFITGRNDYDYYCDERGVIVVKKNGVVVRSKRDSDEYLITLANNALGDNYYKNLLHKYRHSDKKVVKMYRGPRYGKYHTSKSDSLWFDCYVRDRRRSW